MLRIGMTAERAELDRAASDLGVSRSEVLRRGISGIRDARYSGGYSGELRGLADDGYITPPTTGPGDPPPSVPVARPADLLVELAVGPWRRVIYLDTSVALAHLLAEDRRPPAELWQEELVASRFLEYELWNRLHARDLTRSHGDLARPLLARLTWLELLPRVLERALRPFPTPVRTLAALHLASVGFLREHGRNPTLATYDARMADAARAMGIPSQAV